MIGLAETYLLLNAATQTAFRTNPIQFLTGKPAPGSVNITLSELITPKGRFYDIPGEPGVQGASYYIMKNIKTNYLNGLTQMIVIPLAFRLGKAVAKPAISRTNRLLAKGNIANTVKL